MSTVEPEIHPIEQAKRDLSTRPVLAIDSALAAFGVTRRQRTEQKTTAYLDVLARAVINASDVPSPKAGEDPVKAMLADRKCDRMACASLLRLLILDDEVFSNDPRLRLSTALFDRALAKSLYTETELTEKDQAFTKRDRLRTIVAGHEETLFSHVKSLGSLDALDAFRRRFGKLFGTHSTRTFVLPFLPKGVTVQNFDELLGALQAVVACSDISLIGRSETVQKRCNELKGLVEQSKTQYSRELIGALALRAETLARERVDAAGFADPAQLSIELRPKRYPFGHSKVPVAVRLNLINSGPGQAQDVMIDIEGDGAISFDENSKFIGLLSPGSQQVDFHGIVASGNGQKGLQAQSDILLNVTWKNPDLSEAKLEEIATLKAQSGDVPWDDLELEQPYRLEPVTDPKDFVGRQAAVSELAKVILQSGNARIQGEKRVGKTSLAYAVSAAVENQRSGIYTFIHLESGDFNSHTPEETVGRLGELIANQVRRSDQRLTGLEIPEFTSGLATLTDFFAIVNELAPEKQFVVVLDEFDALPHASLYRHEPIGDAFFQTLRSLSGKPNLSFILIGGERMQWVIATHGQTLNKFKLMPLDYFAQDQITDYAELVRAPVAAQLHYADEAIDALYRVTAGNPWMTKRVLSKLFERQVERRDRDVQVDEVEDAINHALPELSVTSFQHFWDDAIRGDVDDREHVSATRRRVLLALARRIQGPGDVTEDMVVDEAKNFNVDEPTARDVVRGLFDRSILKTTDSGGLVCRVPLFERWLVRHGSQEIVLGTGDDDTLIRRQRTIEEMRPKPEELDILAQQWKSYRGKEMRADQIGTWLEQFGGPAEQRLVMPILEGMKFYTRSKVDQHLRDLHQFVLRELASRGYNYKLSGNQRFRNDFLVCGLEGGGSGAAHLVKQYRDENGIYRDCAVDAGSLRKILDGAKQTIKAVIIIDDFVGTGGTAASRLRDLHETWTVEREWPASVDVFFLAISAFDSGIRRVEGAVSRLDWSVTIRVGDALGNEDRCFHEESRVYPDPVDREQAQALCARFGALTSPRNPLGFRRTEAIVCFEYRCPNNTLPVLWDEASDWKPLFPRL
jgi:hypothetical protein